MAFKKAACPLKFLERSIPMSIDYTVPFSNRVSLVGFSEVEETLNDEAFPQNGLSVCSCSLGFAEVKSKVLAHHEVMSALTAMGMTAAWTEELVAICGTGTFKPVEAPVIAAGQREYQPMKYWDSTYARFHDNGVRRLATCQGPYMPGTLFLIARHRNWGTLS